MPRRSPGSTRLSHLAPHLKTTIFQGVLELSFACPACARPVRLQVHSDRPNPRGEVFQLEGKLGHWDLTLSPGFTIKRHSDGKRCGWRGRIVRGEVKACA